MSNFEDVVIKHKILMGKNLKLDLILFIIFDLSIISFFLSKFFLEKGKMDVLMSLGIILLSLGVYVIKRIVELFGVSGRKELGQELKTRIKLMILLYFSSFIMMSLFFFIHL